MSDQAEAPTESENGSMTLWEHLEELRSRIMRMGIAFVIGAGTAWFYKSELLDWLTLPFVTAWKHGKHSEAAALNFSAPASLFIAYVRLSALAGFLFALPFILYQLWAFIAPGLYAKEKRLAIPFVLSSCLLFLSGGYFGWAVAFPAAFEYLLGFSGPIGGNGLEVKPTVMVGDYMDFVTRMFIAFGAVAELPVVAFFLSVTGIINHRHLIRFFRYFVVVAFILAAVLTPPDPLSQVLLAVPLIGLYGVSIGVAWIFGKKREPEAAV